MRGIKTKETFQFTKKPSKIPVELYFASIPDKLVYKTNETLDLTGLEVIAKYNDDTTKNITGDILTEPINGSTLSIIGNNNIIISYTENEVTVSNSFPVVVEVKIVSWSEGTDEEIVAMVEAADRGLIDLTECWAVGNERKITLNAMEAVANDNHPDYTTETQPQQITTFILMHPGGKELITPTPSGRTTCSFIVGQKEVLANQGVMHLEGAYEYSGHWDKSLRRKWCNSVYYNAIPESIRSIFKLHKNYSYYTPTWGNGNANYETQDYFAIPNVIEIIGGANDGELSFQFDWFKNEANRLVKNTSGDYAKYWTRWNWYNPNAYEYEYVYFEVKENYTYNKVYYKTYLYHTTAHQILSYGLIPFGVI